jgi:hypothetical protein
MVWIQGHLARAPNLILKIVMWNVVEPSFIRFHANLGKNITTSSSFHLIV